MYKINSRSERLETGAERLARTLTGQLDIKVVIGRAQGVAHFDLESRSLTVPGYATMPNEPEVANVFRGILDHECGHAIHTDASIVNQLRARQYEVDFPRIKHLWNIFEDAMIEREWVIEYPGSQHHFTVRDEWLDKIVTRSTDPDHALPNGERLGEFGALCRALSLLSRNRSTRSHLHPQVNAQLDRVWPLVEQAFAAPDTRRCWDLAVEIWEQLKEPPEEQEEPEPEEEQEPEEGGDDDQESDAGDGGSEDADGPGDCEDSGSESENSDEPGEDTDTEAGESEKESDTDADRSQDDGSPGEEGAPETRRLPLELVEGGDEDGSGGQPASGDVSAAEEEGDDEVDQLPGAGGVGGAVDPDYHQAMVKGDFGEVEHYLMDVIASKYMDANPTEPYTVFPETQQHDTWDDFAGREVDRDAVNSLRAASSKYANKLKKYMSSAILASKRTLRYGPVDEGDDLSDCAIAGIALGLNSPAIYDAETRHITRSTFVTLLIDCSGSMGSSGSSPACPVHASHRVETRRMRCADCGATDLVYQIRSKAARAALTAAALHQALSECRTPHAVLGFTTGGYHSRPVDYEQYARFTHTLRMLEFVSAPGITDRGERLPFIDGMGGNLDGESVLEAAKYGLHHGKEFDRHILMVVADGLPAGADRPDLEGPHLRDAVERCAQAGIEVYGIGVGIREESVFRSYYPNVKGGRGRAPTGAVMLDRAEGLTDTVLKGLTDLITEGYGRSRQVR